MDGDDSTAVPAPQPVTSAPDAGPLKAAIDHIRQVHFVLILLCATVGYVAFSVGGEQTSLALELGRLQSVVSRLNARPEGRELLQEFNPQWTLQSVDDFKKGLEGAVDGFSIANTPTAQELLDGRARLRSPEGRRPTASDSLAVVRDALQQARADVVVLAPTTSAATNRPLLLALDRSSPYGAPTSTVSS